MSMPKFKAPYAAALSIMCALVGGVLVLFTGYHESAFAYAAAFGGGIVPVAAYAATVRAYNACFVMACCSLGLMLAIFLGLDSEGFKDMVLKGLAGGTGSGMVLLIKTLLDRFKDD